MTTYLTRTTETKKYYRGVAQLVARLLWEQDAAGSNPVTPTIQPPVAREFFSLQAVFYCFSAFSAAIFALPSAIISASLSSHSSRACAYMLKLLRINVLRFGQGLILLASIKALSIFLHRIRRDRRENRRFFHIPILNYRFSCSTKIQLYSYCLFSLNTV